MLDIRIAMVFQEFAELTVKGIQDNIRTKRVTKYGPMNASGLAAESVYYRLTDTGFQIYVKGRAVAYFDTLETGRRPGKPPPKGSMIEWVELRNIPNKWKVTSEIADNIVRFSMAKKGSNLYQMGGNSGIIKDFINPELIKELKDEVIPIYVENVTNYILGAFKSNAA